MVRTEPIARCVEANMRIAVAIFRAGALAMTVATVSAYADQGKTREQVQAEMDAALHAGTVVTGFQGLPPRAMNPDLYPAQPVIPGKTRAQVRADLDAALRAGTAVVVAGFQGIPPRVMNPDLYPAPAAARAPVKTREQVEADRLAAVRAGLVTTRFQGMTPRQRSFIAN